jgi:hypothetical protein
MVRTQVQLTERQVDALKRVASRDGVSMAEVIRRAVDRVTEHGVLPGREELKLRAIAAIGSGHSDKTDLSSRHDDYLAEAYSE